MKMVLVIAIALAVWVTAVVFLMSAADPDESRKMEKIDFFDD